MTTATRRARRPAVRLTEEQIDACFEDTTDQCDVLLRLYRLILPDWDEITSMDGWPSCNERTWKGIARRFVAFDQAHTDAMAGGLWLNRGFTTSHGETLQDGVVSFRGCAIFKGDRT
jgi:hypothetical protein